jgi:hypothetical protein
MFMKRNAMALTLIVSFLLSTLIITPNAYLGIAQTYSTITIKADGSIEGTDKIQQRGTTYTLTGDVYGSIIVRRGLSIED